MYQSDFNGPPAAPFRHKRGGSHNKPGCLGFWTKIPTGAKIKLFLLLMGTLGGFALFLWWVWPRGAAAADTPPTPVYIQTVGPLELPPAEATTPPPLPLAGDNAPLETPDPARTATWVAAISRPAGNPENIPFFVGVVTYEDGCLVSNLGFTTSGYNGKPYYLYINGLLDRDPAMQVVNVRGYVQQFNNCQYPVIVVSEMFWMDQAGTPAPLAIGGSYAGGAITGTVTGTVTATNASLWGQAQPRPTSTTTYTVWIPPQKEFPTPEPWPTYTVYPTYTAQPADVVIRTVVHTVTPNPATPTPTGTATATHTPTPQTLSLFGPVRAVAGCPQSNFAVNASGTNYFIILSGASLPDADPTGYNAMVVGLADTVCSGQAIRANQIIWYPTTPTATVTHTPTVTPTAIATATSTDIPTATITATVVITP